MHWQTLKLLVQALPHLCTLALMRGTQLLWKACVRLQMSHIEKTKRLFDLSPWQCQILPFISFKAFLFYFLFFFFSSLSLFEGIKTCHPHRTEFRLYAWATISVTIVDFWCGRLVDLEAFFTKWRRKGKKMFKFEQDPKTQHLCSEADLSLHKD